MNRRQLLRNIAIATGIGGATLAGLIAYPYLITKARKELMISGSVAVSRFVALLVVFNSLHSIKIYDFSVT